MSIGLPICADQCANFLVADLADPFVVFHNRFYYLADTSGGKVAETYVVILFQNEARSFPKELLWSKME